MTTDQPIPQVIVVGILRVLLTTCPNNQKNSGGIDLHAEWSACLNFLSANRQFFKEQGFKSKVFPKSNTLLDYIPKKERATAEQEDQKEKGAEGQDDEEETEFSKMPEFQFEVDRHRIIVAMVISDFFLFMLKHFKANHLVQFMYLSTLLVDANGVLVLLKFLNQDFGKIDFETRIDSQLDFLKVSKENNMATTMEFGINSMLRLMYKTCKNQKERIKQNLVQYKSSLIMRKLFSKFQLPQIQKNAAKVIKIQIRWTNKSWRKSNERIVSIPYQHCRLSYNDDWLLFEDSPEDVAQQALMMNEDEIRGLNSDFNYNNYAVFYEKLDEDQKEEAQPAEGENSADKPKATDTKHNLVGFQKIISEENILNKMWKNVDVDFERFRERYEDWLEEEVWTYYD